MLLVSAVSACTPGGVATTCALPFKYKGVRYTKCTRKDARKQWCATKTDGNGNYVTNYWAYCGACKKKYICPSTCSKSAKASLPGWQRQRGDCSPPGSRNQTKNGVTNVRLRWTNNLLRYRIGGRFSSAQMNRIRTGAANIERNTGGCVKLREVRGNPRGNYVDVMNYQNSGSQSNFQLIFCRHF